MLKMARSAARGPDSDSVDGKFEIRNPKFEIWLRYPRPPCKPRLELWLVRHGETTYSASKRVAGWSDPPLTDNGRRQAAALRPVIDGTEFDGVWSSDLQRAVESARLAWGEATPDPRLRECNFGSLEGCSYQEADTTYGEVFRSFRDFQAPDGESHADFCARVVQISSRTWTRVGTCSSSTVASSGP